MTMRGLLVLAALVVAPPVADADRREASLHAQLVGGALTTGDADAGDSKSTAPLAGVAIRASYATRDRFQYELGLSVLRAGDAEFPSHTFVRPGRPTVTGPYQVASLLTRVDGGVTLRLGVRWIPTVRLAAGVQLHQVGDATVIEAGVSQAARSSELALGLVGAVAVGLDHRINRRLIVGAAAGGSLAVALDGSVSRSLDLTIQGAYYWYPRW